MTKAVFIASSHSHYQDRPGEVYHFPNSYLSRVAKTVGDWVIFYQGRRGGEMGCYAVQRIERVLPDPADPTHTVLQYLIVDRCWTLSALCRAFAPTTRPTKLAFPFRAETTRQRCG